jgi:phosphoglucomutase
MERIFRETLKIERYFSVDSPDIAIDREGSFRIADTEVTIFDPLADYTSLMEELFNFEVLCAHFRSGFRMLFDAMHGATGPYARHIFELCLGAPAGTGSMEILSKISEDTIRIQIWCTRRTWCNGSLVMVHPTSERRAMPMETAT